MKIVVTGGAGFIGANLCRELESRPEVTRIVVIDDLSTGFADNLSGVRVDLIKGSILDRPTLRDAVNGADGVVHLAARASVQRSVVDPVQSHEANATGTLYVLEECRRIGASVVVASSSSVYGATPELPKHENLATVPQSPYAASKLSAEGYTLAYADTYGLSALAFRFFNVYGPLQSAEHEYAAVIPAFISAALKGKSIHIYGDGKQTRDFTYVGSVVRVLADAAIRKVAAPSPINLAFGSRISLLQVIAKIENQLGGSLSKVFEPRRVGDVRDSQAANSRMLDLFPDCDPVPFDDGLARTVEWFKAQQESSSRLVRQHHPSKVAV